MPRERRLVMFSNFGEIIARFEREEEPFCSLVASEGLEEALYALSSVCNQRLMSIEENRLTAIRTAAFYFLPAREAAAVFSH